MKKLLLLLMALLSCACIGFTYYAEDPIQLLLQKLEKFRRDYPQEKVHLHLDKPYYAIGDSIWFKAYVVQAENRVPSGISAILNVELINDRDSVKKHLRVPLSAGLGWGQIPLTDSMREGSYRIRAYTNWMRNFDEEYFYDRTVNIGNVISNSVFTEVKYTYSGTQDMQKVDARIRYTGIDGQPVRDKTVDYNIQLDLRDIARGKATTDADGTIFLSFVNSQPFVLKSGRINTRITLDNQRSFSKVIPIKATSDSVDVQFFPEGGNLVNGLLSKVAFKAVGSDGIGVDMSGYISTNEGKKLVDIKSEHAGMGMFALLPSSEEKYIATVTFKDGSVKKVPLPDIEPYGYVISTLHNIDKDLIVRISTSPQLVAAGRSILVAQSNNVAHYVSNVVFDKNVITARIPKNRFPTGILQLTLFSPGMQPAAERLVFVNNNDNLRITASTDKRQYTKREKVRLKISALTSRDSVALGSFSVSVIDENKVPSSEDDDVTILSDLLLSSDLRGFIEKPNYYFVGDEIIRKRHLDILLMTQGWRRFNWKSIATETFPALTYAPEKSLSIKGRVTAKDLPVSNGKVTLFTNNGGLFYLDTLTDAAGRFNFDNLVFSDTTRFLIQARNQKDRRNVQIAVDHEPVQPVNRNINYAMVDPNLDMSIYDYLKNSYNQYADLRAARSILLEEVAITANRSRNLINSSNLNGSGNADQVIRAEDIEKVMPIDLAQYLTGRVAGLVIRNNIPYLTRNMNLSGPIPMQINLDGMMVDGDYLTLINPMDVESMEILKSSAYTSIYGMQGGGGVIVINTKKGRVNTTYRAYAPGIVTYNPKGYHIAREFYSPNYDVAANTNKPDLRSTIYWNPFITPNEGTASVEYFNADGTGTYKVIVEGITGEGYIGRAVYRYTVK